MGEFIYEYSDMVSWKICATQIPLFLAFWFGFASTFRPTALKCPPCDVSNCPSLGKCVAGITWDVCNCCETCAKAIGEECGGPWNAYGNCGVGLKCLKDVRECPYLFNIRRSVQSVHNNKVCEEFISNTIGRCVQNSHLVNPVFKRFGFRGKPMSDTFLEQEEAPSTSSVNVSSLLQGMEKIVPGGEAPSKRFLLGGILRGVEF